MTDYSNWLDEKSKCTLKQQCNYVYVIQQLKKYLKSKFKFQVFPSRQDRKQICSFIFWEKLRQQFGFKIYWHLAFKLSWITTYLTLCIFKPSYGPVFKEENGISEQQAQYARKSTKPNHEIKPFPLLFFSWKSTCCGSQWMLVRSPLLFLICWRPSSPDYE